MNHVNKTVARTIIGWNPMEQVHDRVRRGPPIEILSKPQMLPVSPKENQFLSRSLKQNEKRISKSTFWRMLGPNLQKIMDTK